MRRLSIIDLPGGHQPAWNEAKDVAVIFNGEIYNYRELRERLNSLGHRFATQSDTEVLVHALGRVGRGLPHRIARDVCVRAARSAQTLCHFSAFVSRTRSAGHQAAVLHADARWLCVRVGGARVAGRRRRAEKRISQDALTSYLLFGSVSEPVTIARRCVLSAARPPHAAVCAGTPAHAPRAAVVGSAAKSRGARYPQKPRDFSAAAKRLRPLLEDAVRAHLIADVPGRTLSFQRPGFGRDCGTGGACTARHSVASRLSFPGTPYDEAPLARVVAERCGTRHREIPLDGDAVLGATRRSVWPRSISRRWTASIPISFRGPRAKSD